MLYTLCRFVANVDYFWTCLSTIDIMH